MLHALLISRLQSLSHFFRPSKSSSSQLPLFACRVTMKQARSESTEPEKNQKLTEKATSDVMSNSFGEGYSTRSDEEGFGGVYGGNQEEQNNSQCAKQNQSEYDKSQGCEVKEKEKSRHQSDKESSSSST